MYIITKYIIKNNRINLRIDSYINAVVVMKHLKCFVVVQHLKIFKLFLIHESLVCCDIRKHNRVINIAVFNLWDVSSKSPASIILIMEAICYFQTSVQFCHATRCHISWEANLRSLLCENLKPPLLALWPSGVRMCFCITVNALGKYLC